MARVPTVRGLRTRVSRALTRAARRIGPAERAAVKTWVTPGHFYSPIPDWAALEPRADQLFPATAPTALPDVDLAPTRQLAYLDRFGPLREDRLYAPGDPRAVRYHADNRMFGQKSANALHFMLRTLAPKRVVEVGSGFSSAVMLDTDEHHLGGALDLTFVEPYPERLYGVMTAADRARAAVVETTLQAAPRAPFEALDAGDVLFVDSSHVLKTGSDLTTLFFEILPRLRSGVYVHFHDVLYPFEYPRAWVAQGRAWNEAYALRAFLAYNRAFEVEFWASYLFRCHPGALSRVPEVQADGSSIWIRKVA